MQFDIRYFETVDSTMDIAREEALANATEGLVIQAGEQLSGRGRRGNQWSSPKGNLYQSIIVRPSVQRQYWGQLSFVVAIALAMGTLQFVVSPRDTTVNVKWPNDVMVNDRKLAGILIEAGNDHVIIGTGINIAHAPEGRAKLHDIIDIEIDAFRDAFLLSLKKHYNMWQTEGFDPIRTIWLNHAYKIGEAIQARLPNVIYEGVFEGIDPQGNLLLRADNGSLRQINSGEIITGLNHVFSD